MNYHSGYRYQRGRGIGSMFAGLFRALKPMAMMGLNAGKKLLTSDTAKKFGSKIFDIGKTAAKDVLIDVLEGKKFADSSVEKLEEAKEKIAKTIRGEGAGGTCVRKRRKKQKNISKTENKKRKYNLLD